MFGPALGQWSEPVVVQSGNLDRDPTEVVPACAVLTVAAVHGAVDHTPTRRAFPWLVDSYSHFVPVDPVVPNSSVGFETRPLALRGLHQGRLGLLIVRGLSPLLLAQFELWKLLQGCRSRRHDIVRVAPPRLPLRTVDATLRCSLLVVLCLAPRRLCKPMSLPHAHLWTMQQNGHRTRRVSMPHPVPTVPVAPETTGHRRRSVPVVVRSDLTDVVPNSAVLTVAADHGARAVEHTCFTTDPDHVVTTHPALLPAAAQVVSNPCVTLPDLDDVGGGTAREAWSGMEGVKSIPPNTENWLRKRYNYSMNSDKSTEDKHETNHINNKCNDMNTRKMHIT